MNIEKNVTLYDSDGDGIIQFRWNDKHSGVSIEVVDMFDKAVVGTFYKKDLTKFLRKFLTELKKSEQNERNRKDPAPDWLP